MIDLESWLPLIARGAVVGVLGGTGLVLTQIYSRRGPLIFPVYAAILAALGFVGVRFEELPFAAHFSAVLVGMVISTSFAFIAVLILGARERRELLASGRPIAPGGAPWWGFPVIGLAIVISSAAVAYLSS